MSKLLTCLVFCIIRQGFFKTKGLASRERERERESYLAQAHIVPVYVYFAFKLRECILT